MLKDISVTLPNLISSLFVYRGYPSWCRYRDWYCRHRHGKTARSCFGFVCWSSLLQPSSPRAPWLTVVLHGLPGLSVWPWALRFAVDTWGHAGRRRVIMRRRPRLLLPNLPSSPFVSLPFALSCHPSPLLFIIASPLRPMHLVSTVFGCFFVSTVSFFFIGIFIYLTRTHL